MIKLNLNPKGIKSGDCVIRAVAYATEQSWDKVYKDLCDIGFKMKRLPNDKLVYEKYLNQLGWLKQKQPRHPDNTKYCVYEFTEYKIVPGKIIVSVANHLTCIDNYEIVDTWNCGGKCIGNYWIKGDSIK